jgi:hypothetical protein
MQLIPLKPLSLTWLKASVVGSIWAAVEIILGSFLLFHISFPISQYKAGRRKEFQERQFTEY